MSVSVRFFSRLFEEHGFLGGGGFCINLNIFSEDVAHWLKHVLVFVN